MLPMGMLQDNVFAANMLTEQLHKPGLSACPCYRSV